MLGVSRQTVYRMISDGRLRKPNTIARGVQAFPRTYIERMRDAISNQTETGQTDETAGDSTAIH